MASTLTELEELNAVGRLLRGIDGTRTVKDLRDEITDLLAREYSRDVDPSNIRQYHDSEVPGFKMPEDWHERDVIGKREGGSRFIRGKLIGHSKSYGYQVLAKKNNVLSVCTCRQVRFYPRRCQVAFGGKNVLMADDRDVGRQVYMVNSESGVPVRQRLVEVVPGSQWPYRSELYGSFRFAHLPPSEG